MKRIVLFTLPLLLFAQDPKIDLLAALNEATEIASATKLNIDKVPSTTTLLDRDFIEKSGARTLYDLLRYIPGIELSITPSGKEQIIIRGVKNTYRDKIKFLIDGVEITNNLYTNQFYYYSFPADLIERIEFTKTPDSVTYGNNAFLGAINIITKKESTLSYYQSDQNRYSATFSFKKEFDKFALALDGYTLRSAPTLYAKPTYLVDLGSATATLFRTSQQANTLQTSKGIGVRLYDEHWELYYRYHYYKKGGFFGISRLTPLVRDQFVHFHHQFIQLAYHRFISPQIQFKSTLRYRKYRWNGSFRTYPYTLDPDSSAQDDIIAGANIPEDQIYADLQLKYFGDQHTLSLSLDAQYAKPHDFYYIQYIPSIDGGPTPLTGDQNVLKEGISRKNFGVSIQDLYTLNDHVSLSYGARIDKYSDFGSKFSYKVGAVFNFGDNSFKLLLNQAYRAPSWIELDAQAAVEFNGNENLNAEKITMLEAQLLHRFSDTDLLQTTFYYGYNDDTIDRYIDPATGKKVYRNMGRLKIQGVEVSYTKIFGASRLRCWAAYNDTKKEYRLSILDSGLNYTRKWLANATYITNLGPLSSFTTLFYGSSIKTPDFIDDIPQYFRLDQTFSYNIGKTKVQFGITNLLDHKNYDIATPSELINGRYVFVFEDGRLPQVGRSFFVRVSKRF